jgi:hypothetical protein
VKRISSKPLDEIPQYPGFMIELFRDLVPITNREEAQIMGHFNFRFEFGARAQCHISIAGISDYASG